MNLVTIEQCRAHCRLYGTEHDTMLTLYADAAEASAQQYIDRNVYVDEDAMAAAVTAGTAGDAPMVVTPDIKAAILLMVGHMFENREDVVVSAGNSVSVVEIPLGSRTLLHFHRKKLGV